MTDDDQDFYAAMPVFDSFADVINPSSYRPVPEDWAVGFSDVVGSTKAIAEGRYKAVNMVGAGVIAAVANALQRRPFPYVFGGDGASFAVSAADAAAAAEALRRWRCSPARSCKSSCAWRWFRSRRSGRPDATSASPVSPPRRIAPMRCSPAAASRGSRRK